jgi:photosystem II stability/assembly factor-like uncharacterized protein
MVAGDEGWVRSEVGVFWTRNGGRSWRPITPPVPHGFAIAGVYFASPRRGWALADAGGELEIRASMYRTTDGGRTWHRTSLRGAGFIRGATKVSFSLVGGHELFVMARESGDTASNFGVLLVSHDSGRHWRALPSPPKAGRISFETPRRGWLAVAWPGLGLLRTLNGGRSWVEVQPGKPPGTPTPKGREPGLREAVWGAYYTTPLIGPNGTGILGMVEMPDKSEIEGKSATPAVVLRTTDDGRSWHRTAKIELPEIGGVFDASEVFAPRGRTLSFFFRSPESGARTVIGPDGHPGPLHPSPDISGYGEVMTFSDTKHGFAFPEYGSHPSLLVTKNGGHTWTPVPVPRAPQGN